MVEADRRPPRPGKDALRPPHRGPAGGPRPPRGPAPRGPIDPARRQSRPGDPAAVLVPGVSPGQQTAGRGVASAARRFHGVTLEWLDRPRGPKGGIGEVWNPGEDPRHNPF